MDLGSRDDADMYRLTTIADFEAQAEFFKARVDNARKELAMVTKGTTPLNRPPGIAQKAGRLEDAVQAAEQAYRNAERVLQLAKGEM